MTVSDALNQKLGLTGITFKHNLNKSELFQEAIANDRGRVRLDGPMTSVRLCDQIRRQRSSRLLHRSNLHRPPGERHFMVAWPELRAKCGGKTTCKSTTRTSLKAYFAAWWNSATNAVGICTSGRVCRGDLYAVPYRFVGEYATHAMFAHNMFPKSWAALKTSKANAGQC